VTECLKEHTQYVCSKCGRAICIDKGVNGKYRIALPFKTLRIAKYYLRAAEIVYNSICEIYEFEDDDNRKFYMIFKDHNERDEYLAKNKRFKLSQKDPLFTSPSFSPFDLHQCRRLSDKEIKHYLSERGGRIWDNN
jgi:hypothetical protein